MLRLSLALLLWGVCTIAVADDEMPPPPPPIDSPSPSPPSADIMPGDDATPSPSPTESLPPVNMTTSVPAPETTESAPVEASLPPIEATSVDLKPLKASTSKRVYLFEVSSPAGSSGETDIDQPASNSPPPERKILLIKSGEENIMALRVLKVMPEKKQLIAKQIRKYPNHDELALGENYHAIQKISDSAPPPSDQDKADIAEVESMPLAYDPELDAGSSPDPKNQESKEEEDAKLGASVEESNLRFERQKNWLTASLGLMFNNPGPDIGKTNYTAGGVRYGYSILDKVFTKPGGRHVDSLVLEGSLFFYKISGLDNADDNYTVIPAIGTARYNYFLTEDFAFFAYAGLEKNFVTAISDPAAKLNRAANLGQTQAALGLGGMYRVGPQWYVRLDAGLDIIGLGLMLRF